MLRERRRNLQSNDGLLKNNIILLVLSNLEVKIEKNKKISSTHRARSAGRGYWPLPARVSQSRPTSGAAILDASCNCCFAH